MTKKEGITLVTELEAARILEAQGWRKVACEKCHTTGEIDTAAHRTFTDAPDRIRRTCPVCEGAKFTWEKPVL